VVTVIVLMLWLWMSATVMLIGDQLNVTVGESMQLKSEQKFIDNLSETQ
jgi:membrane protein